MRFHSILLLALAAALLGGCSRPRPAAEYADARALWTDLLREKLDGAADDPRAQTVLSLLARVPAESADADHARQLKTEIEQARAEALSVQARRAREIANAEAALRPPPALLALSVAASAAAPAAAPVEAPPAPATPPQPADGMDAEAFRKDFTRCFEYHTPALVGGIAGGEVWGLKDLSICRDLHPEFARKSVLLFDGKVAVRPSSELALKRYRVVDGRLIPADEAGAKSPAAPAGGPEAQAPPAAP